MLLYCLFSYWIFHWFINKHAYTISRLESFCHRQCHTTMPHDDVIKWKHFPRYWPFLREIHRSPVNSPHKGQWRGSLMFSLICAWINGWVNNREAGDLIWRPLWRHSNNGLYSPGLRLVLYWCVLLLHQRAMMTFWIILLNLDWRGIHNSDVIMSTMASHTTSLTSVHSTVYSGGDIYKKNIKAPRHWPLWGEFTGDRRISNAENVPIWWRHHDMLLTTS